MNFLFDKLAFCKCFTSTTSRISTFCVYVYVMWCGVWVCVCVCVCVCERERESFKTKITVLVKILFTDTSVYPIKVFRNSLKSTETIPAGDFPRRCDNGSPLSHWHTWILLQVYYPYIELCAHLSRAVRSFAVFTARSLRRYFMCSWRSFLLEINCYRQRYLINVNVA